MKKWLRGLIVVAVGGAFGAVADAGADAFASRNRFYAVAGAGAAAALAGWVVPAPQSRRRWTDYERAEFRRKN